MSRRPVFTAFVGPGHKRHAFYLITVHGSGSRHVPACNADTTGKIINHQSEPYQVSGASTATCARCRSMAERVFNGVTPPHLQGVIS